METKPSFSEFLALSKKAALIPVYQELLADTDTPVSAYLKIKDKSFSYLLESAEGGKHWGRYSFIGYKPCLTASFRGNEMLIRQNGQEKILHDISNPIDILRDINHDFLAVSSKDLAPFQGGLVGFFNYDLIRKWEHLPGTRAASSNQPEAVFTIAGRLIIFDHLTHHMKIVAFAHLDGKSKPEEAYLKACQDVDETIEELRQPFSPQMNGDPLIVSELKSNFTKDDFKDAVLKAKEYIVAGDVIQVVLSQRFSGEISGDDFSLYRSLRSVNPSPYMFYLNFGEDKIIGASPEILVRLTDGKIELRPIAGTRPRGMTSEEDLALEEDLMGDPKERAEHVMLVDLGRNDVGKVALPGSVTVPRLMEVEHYSHVMHIVSRVEGQLKKEMDAFDLFMSAFPAGTVSGAPKIRAMEIISELEPTPRGPYAGAVGYFGFNGNMDFSITIRTITINKDILSVQVGAGIVADSSPEGEYQETLKKGAAMFKAIKKVNL